MPACGPDKSQTHCAKETLFTCLAPCTALAIHAVMLGYVSAEAHQTCGVCAAHLSARCAGQRSRRILQQAGGLFLRASLLAAILACIMPGSCMSLAQESISLSTLIGAASATSAWLCRQSSLLVITRSVDCYKASAAKAPFTVDTGIGLI